jgi:hypothetical protein
MMVTTLVMTMTVEVMVAAVVGTAISLRGAEERGRRATHNNQLNDDNKAAYDVHEHDDDAAYDNDVASGFAIEWTPAQLGRQRQLNNGEDASPTMAAQQQQRCQRNAGKTGVQRGQQHQCTDGNDEMMATTPEKRWLRPSATWVSTPAECM